jgi:hypothetical protein
MRGRTDSENQNGPALHPGLHGPLTSVVDKLADSMTESANSIAGPTTRGCGPPARADPAELLTESQDELRRALMIGCERSFSIARCPAHWKWLH